MFESVIILGKVAFVCCAGFIVATGFEWFTDIKVTPKNKLIKLGQENKKEAINHDDQINNLRQRIRSQS